MKFAVASLAVLLVCGCATKPSAPVQIPAPEIAVPVDHSGLSSLATDELLSKYADHLKEMAHLMSETDQAGFIDSSVNKLKSQYGQNEARLRDYIVNELKLSGRNVEIELQTPPEPPVVKAVTIAECWLRFDDSEALGNVVNQARTTFAVWSQSGATSCSSSSSSGCWIYKQNCGLLGNVRYEEYPFGAYNHFHLSFENLDCLDFSTGSFGREQADGTCSSAGIDHREENRYANGHVNSHVQRLWVEDGGDAALFSVDRVRVRGEDSQPARILFKKQDGSWWAWNSLSPGYYDIGEWVNDVVEMRFRGAEGGLSVTGIDDLRIRRIIVSEPPRPPGP